MKRRELSLLVIGASGVWARASWAQPKAMPVIGFLNAGSAVPALLDAFFDGLASSGYREGRNVLIDYRWADGDYERLQVLAAGLVRRPVHVIVTTGGGIAAQVAKAATNTIPIVALSGGDFIGTGLASSLNRPGGNVTGVAQLVVEAEAKRLQLLHELIPAADTIAYLENPAFTGSVSRAQSVSSLARSLGVTLFIVKASNANGLVEAFDAISQRRVGALLVGSDPFFFTQREQLVALAARHAVPAMYFFREFSVAGGLISYGTRLADGYRQVGIYTGKILNGANPAELPIARQSEQIEMSLNIKTARTLGLAIPPSILGRADEIIE